MVLQPTTPLRPRRHRLPPALIVSAWAGGIALVAAIALDRGSMPEPTSPGPSARVVAASAPLDSGTPLTRARLDGDGVAALRSVIPLVHGPMGVGVGLGSVWAVTAKDLRLRRIDPDNDRIVAVIDLPYVAPRLAPGATPLATASGETAFSTVGSGTALSGSGILPGVAIAGGSVWVFGVPSTDAVVQVDPNTNRVVGTLPLPLPATGIVSGPAGTWVTTDHGRIVGINTATGRVGPVVRVGRDRVAAAAGRDATWFSSGDGRTVRVDAGGRTTARIVAGGGPIAIVDGVVWIAARGFITRVDERTAAVIDRREIGTSGDSALVRAVPSIAVTGYDTDASAVAPRGTAIADTGSAEWVCRPDSGEIWVLQTTMR